MIYMNEQSCSSLVHVKWGNCISLTYIHTKINVFCELGSSQHKCICAWYTLVFMCMLSRTSASLNIMYCIFFVAFLNIFKCLSSLHIEYITLYSFASHNFYSESCTNLGSYATFFFFVWMVLSTFASQHLHLSAFHILVLLLRNRSWGV